MPGTRRIAWRQITLASLALLLGAPQAVRAAEPPGAWPYKSASTAITDAREVRRLRQEVRAALTTSGALSTAQQDTVNNYYGKVIFAAMTRPEAVQDPSRFPAWRFEIVRDLSGLSNRSAHDFLRDRVFYYGKQLAAGDFHPACRYNALLILGMLNETETRRVGLETIPAVPYPSARQYLLQVLSSSQDDSLQIAALIGLQRHAKLLAAAGGMDNALVRPLVDILRTSQPAASSSADALHWKQRLCVETLGAMGQPGAAPLLEPIVTNDQLPLSLRCAAAMAVGQLEFRNPGDANPGSLAKGLGQVALSACRDEMQRMQEVANQNSDDSVINPGRAMVEGGDTPPEDPAIRLSRGSLKYNLLCVRQGLLAVERITSDANQKQTITAMKGEVESILRGLDSGSEGLTAQEFLQRVGPAAVRLEQVVTKAA